MDLDMFIIDTHILTPLDRIKLYNDLKRVSWDVFHGDRDDLTIRALIPKGKTPSDLLVLPPNVTFHKF